MLMKWIRATRPQRVVPKGEALSESIPHAGSVCSVARVRDAGP
jgi:hypothetical protein